MRSSRLSVQMWWSESSWQTPLSQMCWSSKIQNSRFLMMGVRCCQVNWWICAMKTRTSGVSPLAVTDLCPLWCIRAFTSLTVMSLLRFLSSLIIYTVTQFSISISSSLDFTFLLIFISWNRIVVLCTVPFYSILFYLSNRLYLENITFQTKVLPIKCNLTEA